MKCNLCIGPYNLNIELDETLWCSFGVGIHLYHVSKSKIETAATYWNCVDSFTKINTFHMIYIYICDIWQIQKTFLRSHGLMDLCIHNTISQCIVLCIQEMLRWKALRTRGIWLACCVAHIIMTVFLIVEDNSYDDEGADIPIISYMKWLINIGKHTILVFIL